VGEPNDSRPVLKGALHTHTTCSDGDLSPDEVLRAYHDLEFDFIALTDHDFIMTPDAYDRWRVPGVFDGMLVFRGVEKTVFARGYVHVNQITGIREQLNILNHPGQYGLPASKVACLISDLEATLPIHAVEVTLKGFYTPEYDVDDIPLPKVASDDSHSIDCCGRAWIEVACEKDPDAILRAIKAGRAVIRHTSTFRQVQWFQQGGTPRD
jgi:hypothetical protein